MKVFRSGFLLLLTFTAVAMMVLWIEAPTQKKVSSPPQTATVEAKSSTGPAVTTPPESPEDFQFPTAHDLANDRDRDPKGTPPSLLRLAEALAEPMERARGSATMAQKLFSQLATCALDSDESITDSSVQAFCGANAAALAVWHPRILGGAYQKLLQGLPNHVQKIIEALNR